MKIVRYMTVIKNSLEFLILRKDRKAQKKGLWKNVKNNNIILKWKEKSYIKEKRIFLILNKFKKENRVSRVLIVPASMKIKQKEIWI